MTPYEEAKKVQAIYNKLGGSTKEYKVALTKLAHELGYANSVQLKDRLTDHACKLGVNYTAYIGAPGNCEQRYIDSLNFDVTKKKLLARKWA
jgi:hypothetical protein